ncbi:hypothetical protein GCM10010402_03170 [Actinomadura luteofluorescens]
MPVVQRGSCALSPLPVLTVGVLPPLVVGPDGLELVPPGCAVGPSPPDDVRPALELPPPHPARAVTAATANVPQMTRGIASPNESCPHQESDREAGPWPSGRGAADRPLHRSAARDRLAPPSGPDLAVSLSGGTSDEMSGAARKFAPPPKT